MRLIACCSMAPPVAHLATSQRGKVAASSERPSGWTAGAGIEAAFTDNLTAKIEYLYLKLGNSLCTSNASCGNDPGGPPNDTVKFSTSMIRLGINYKFR